MVETAKTRDRQPLIVDEAHRIRFSGLECIRDLADACGIPVLPWGGATGLLAGKRGSGRHFGPALVEYRVQILSSAVLFFAIVLQTRASRYSRIR